LVGTIISGFLAIFYRKPGLPHNPAFFANKLMALAGIPGNAGLD
jgi:hypothetical protein